MPKKKIKPCPFCGGEGEPDQLESLNDQVTYFIRCVCCACEGPWHKTASGAVKLWNTRAYAEIRER